MAITEQQVFQALGLGGKAQEVADPATQQNQTGNDPQPDVGGEGANGQEVADPAAGNADVSGGGSTEPTAVSADDDDAASAADPKSTQSPEERRANAARRRQQEQEQAVAAAVAEALKKEREDNDARMKAFFDRAQLKNNFTGQPITNLEEFQAWDQQHKEEQMRQGLKSGKLTPEILNQVVESHPTVQKAAEFVKRSEEDSRKAQEAAAKVKVEQQIAEIAKMDPTIQSIDDLLKAPNAKQFYDYVKKGNSFVDAYRLANYDRLMTGAAEAARQQATSNARGKEHLQATGNSRGSGAAPVPKGELAMYRLLNPKATEAQIQAHFNKYKK